MSTKSSLKTPLKCFALDIEAKRNLTIYVVLILHSLVFGSNFDNRNFFVEPKVLHHKYKFLSSVIVAAVKYQLMV